MVGQGGSGSGQEEEEDGRLSESRGGGSELIFFGIFDNKLKKLENILKK